MSDSINRKVVVELAVRSAAENVRELERFRQMGVSAAEKVSAAYGAAASRMRQSAAALSGAEQQLRKESERGYAKGLKAVEQLDRQRSRALEKDYRDQLNREERANKEKEREYQKGLKAVEQLDKQRSRALEKDYRDQLNREERANKEKEREYQKGLKAVEQLDKQRSRALEKDYRDQLNRDERARKEKEREYQKGLKAVEQLDKQRSRALEKDYRDQLNRDERARKEKEREYQKGLKAVEQLDRQQSRAYMKELQDRDKATKDAASKAIHAERDRVAAAKRFGSEIKQLLVGTTELARGLAYVGLMSEESTDKLAKGLIRVEAAFSVIKGGIDIYFSLKEAVDAATKSTLTLAAANEAAALAEGAGIAGGAVMGKGGGLRRYGGELASTFAGTALGGVVNKWGGRAAGMLSRYGGAALSGGGALLNGGVRLAGTTAGMGAITGAALWEMGGAAGRSMGYENGWTRSRFGTAALGGAIGRGAFGAAQWMGYAPERNTSAELDRLRQRYDARLLEEASANRDIESRRSMEAVHRSDMRSVAERRDAVELGGQEGGAAVMAERERLRAVQEVQQAEAALENVKKSGAERKKQHQDALLADELTANARMRAALEQSTEAEKRSLDVIRDQVEAKKQMVSAAEKEVERTRELMKTEEEKARAQNARIGRLDKGDYNKLEKIAAKKARGEELTERDAKILDQTGYSDVADKEFYGKRGTQRKGSNIDAVLRGTESMDQARQGVTSAEEKLAKARADAEKAQKDQTEAQNRNTAALERLEKLLMGTSGQNGGTTFGEAQSDLEQRLRAQYEEADRRARAREESTSAQRR